MELEVDHVAPTWPGCNHANRDQTVVVLAPALRTGTVARCERGRLVEEEELRVTAWLEERSAGGRGLEPARDPALHRVATANAALGVVERAAIAVHEASGRVRNQLAEGRDPVLKRAQTSPSNVSCR